MASGNWKKMQWGLLSAAMAGRSVGSAWADVATDLFAGVTAYRVGKASFYHASFGVVFSRAPLRPPRSFNLVQPVEQSAGGIVTGFPRLGKNDLINLQLRLTRLERDQLRFFHDVAVRSRALPFVYLDTSGTPYNVYFEGPPRGMHEVAYDAYTPEVTLRIV